MRIYLYIVSALIMTFSSKNAISQHIDKKDFKTARTIRLYVNDSSENAAIERFVGFFNKTGFKASISKTENIILNNNKSNDAFQTDIILPSVSLKGGQDGDTIISSTETLYDVMMGDYLAKLKFYPARDDTDKLYIAVSAYVSNFAFGGNFSDLKMQRGGKGSNWAQRAIFKDLKKHLSSYTGVYFILYSDE